MNEGWFEDDYFVLFFESERLAASDRYGISATLPGYTIVGLRGWDDLIVQDTNDGSYAVPGVPLEAQYLSTCAVPAIELLEPDARFTGKIKWYVKPIVFGGDPVSKDNVTWVNHQQHAELVVWWNDLSRKLKASDAGV